MTQQYDGHYQKNPIAAFDHFGSFLNYFQRLLKGEGSSNAKGNDVFRLHVFTIFPDIIRTDRVHSKDCKLRHSISKNCSDR